MATRSRSRWARPAAEAALVMVALLLMLAAAVGGFLVGRETAEDEDGAAVAAETTSEATTSAETETSAETATETAETTTGETDTGGGGGEDADGEAVFASAGCGNCHTFEAAGSTGNAGPPLDGIDLSKDEIEQQVRNGGNGMPPFEGQLSDDEIEAVADFVESG